MNDSTESDATLLRCWLENRNEQAFVALVQRYSGLVHMAAMRISGDADLAADASQNTFMVLAQKAKGLSARESLAGWLHLTAVMQTRNLLHKRQRETRKIQNLLHHMETRIQDHTAEEWQRIQPVLDEALASLSSKDREAILLRYYRSHSVQETASALGIATEAAQKRINRAISKLRSRLARRGCHTSGSFGAAMAMGFGMDFKSSLPSSSQLAAKAISSSAATSHLTTVSIIIMTKKSAVIAGSTLLLAGIGAFVVQQTSEKPGSVANARISTASEATTKSSVSSSDSEPAASTRSRRLARNPELVAKYGESRTNLSRHVSEKIIAILESTNEIQSFASSNMKAASAEVEKAILRSELGDTFDQMQLSDEQLQKVSTLFQEWQKQKMDQLKERTEQLRKDPSPLMQAILANDAFSRGEIGEEERQRLMAGVGPNGIDLTSSMGFGAMDQGHLLSNPETMNRFKGILNSDQQSQLQTHLDEEQANKSEKPEEASNQLAGIPAMGLEQLDKTIDSAQKMTSGMKSMMEGMDGMQGMLPELQEGKSSGGGK